MRKHSHLFAETYDGLIGFGLGKGKKGFKAVFEVLFFIVLIIWSYEILAGIIGIEYHILPAAFYSIIIDNTAMKITGLVFIATGYIIFVLSLIAFGSSWRIGIDKNSPGKLITKGIFSISRNPIFLYMDMYFIGAALINTNLFFIICAIAFISGIHYQILQEEKYLKENYKAEYVEYIKKVRRYF